MHYRIYTRAKCHLSHPSSTVDLCKEVLTWPPSLTPVIQSLTNELCIISSSSRVLFGIRNPGLIPTYNSPTLNEYKITTNTCSFDLANFFCTSQKQIKQNQKSSKDNDLNYTELLQSILHIQAVLQIKLHS